MVPMAHRGETIHGGNPCVYIVDDEEAVRDSLSFLLESKGYVVKSFGSAPAFLAAAPSLPIGCLIVDVRMPEMDGLELQEQLRTRMLGFPMIVITGHADVPLAVRAMKAGAVDFIEKPFASETILASLGGALSRLASPNERDPAAEQRLKSWRCCRRASGRCWWVCSLGCPTNRSPTISKSAHVQSRSIARA